MTGLSRFANARLHADLLQTPGNGPPTTAQPSFDAPPTHPSMVPSATSWMAAHGTTEGGRSCAEPLLRAARGWSHASSASSAVLRRGQARALAILHSGWSQRSVDRGGGRIAEARQYIGRMGVLTALLNRMPGLPSVCQVCGSWPAAPVCPACRQRHAPPIERCLRCARPLPEEAPLCGECLIATESSPVQRCLTAVDYIFPWDKLIGRFKFRNEPGWAGALGELMVQSATRQEFLAPDMLLAPVPVTRARLAERGYNQAWELCRAIGRQTGLQTMAEALVRLGDTPDQHRLTRAQRLVNLRGVFVVNPLMASKLAGKRVILVDDVRTTGATLHHSALALRQVGAAEVRGLVLARTPQATQDGKAG